MMINTPIPAAAAAAAPPPAAPPAGPAPGAPAGAPATTAPPAAGATPRPDDAPAIPTREQAIRETMSMSAQDAAAAVASNFDALGKLTVGGGTKEGTEHARLAATLLSNSSSMLQLAHLKASEHLRTLADELDMQMMGAATSLAFVGGQVALAGGSKQPVKVAELAAEPMAMSSAALADVLAAIAPPTPKEPATPDAPAADAGEAPPATDAPTAPAATPAATAPVTTTPAPVATAPPHVTPGPGAGRGPNPA